MSAMNAPVKNCDFCGGGGHQSQDCQEGNPFAHAEQANYMQNFQRGQGNFNGNQFYNPNWRNHPNLSWSNNPQQPQQQQRFEPQQQRRSPEDMLSKYIEANEARMKNQEASIKNIETQIGQLTNLLTNRAPGALPSDTEKNPREQANAITLRSGTKYDEPRMKEAEAQEKEKDVDPQKEGDAEDEEAERAKEKARVDQRVKEYQKRYDRIPFPGRLKKQMEEKHYKKFLDIFRSLHINIPLADALEQMPKYAKYLKDMLTKKRKWEEHETVMLTEESSAILRKKLPPKLKDPGSFSIPCMIGETQFNNALCDLGASVNLMPFSLFEKLGVGDVKPTTISL